MISKEKKNFWKQTTLGLFINLQIKNSVHHQELRLCSTLTETSAPMTLTRPSFYPNTSLPFIPLTMAYSHTFHLDPLPPKVEQIEDIPISPGIIYKILTKLKPNSAAGPDQLPPIFFHHTAKTVSFPLSILYRSLIDLHTVPDEWRLSIITPKFKKGSPSEVSNYRPIALTCTACKILESLISSALLDFLQQRNLISTLQHGFLKKHSTTTNLLSCLNDWTLSMHSHFSTVVAYIDFHRAFDAISHKKLIYKQKSYGIGGNLLFWIQSLVAN